MLPSRITAREVCPRIVVTMGIAVETKVLNLLMWLRVGVCVGGVCVYTYVSMCACKYACWGVCGYIRAYIYTYL